VTNKYNILINNRKLHAILTQWPSLFKASAIVLRRLGHCCATYSTTSYKNYSITMKLCNKNTL